LVILFGTGQVFAEDHISIETDAGSYFTDDVMIVSGVVPNWKMPVIAMSIFDPDGEILSANNVEIDADGTFTKIVFLDSPFYDKPGTYLIIVEYGKNSALTTFEVISDNLPEEQPVQTPIVTPKVAVLETSKKAYSDGEFIAINGAVSTAFEPTVLIGIHNPDGTPAGFYIANVGADLKFSTSFLAKGGVNFKIPGTYSVKAHYANTNMATTFDFVESPPPQGSSTGSKTEPKPKSSPEPAPKNSGSAAPKNPQTGSSSPKVEPKNAAVPESQTKPVAVETKPNDTVPNIDSVPAGNLSVEDEELGIMLNEIMLSCDTSEFRDSIIYYDGMGPALMRLCKYEQAISSFDDALIKKPDSVEIYSNKGTALAKMGQYSMAIAHYDEALKINPNFVPALNNKANVLMYLGEYDEAIYAYNTALRIDPAYAISQENLEKARIKYVEMHRLQDLPALPQSDIVLVEQQTQVEVLPSPVPLQEPKVERNIFERIGTMFSSIGSIFGVFS